MQPNVIYLWNLTGSLVTGDSDMIGYERAALEGSTNCNVLKTFCLHSIFICFTNYPNPFRNQGCRKRDTLDSRSKRGEWAVEEIHRPCPTFHHSSRSQLQSFWGDQWKTACQQSSGYTVHPVLFPPKGSQYYQRIAAKIHFLLQIPTHRSHSWIYE